MAQWFPPKSTKLHLPFFISAQHSQSCYPLSLVNNFSPSISPQYSLTIYLSSILSHHLSLVNTLSPSISRQHSLTIYLSSTLSHHLSLVNTLSPSISRQHSLIPSTINLFSTVSYLLHQRKMINNGSSLVERKRWETSRLVTHSEGKPVEADKVR